MISPIPFEIPLRQLRTLQRLCIIYRHLLFVSLVNRDRHKVLEVLKKLPEHLRLLLGGEIFPVYEACKYLQTLPISYEERAGLFGSVNGDDGGEVVDITHLIAVEHPGHVEGDESHNDGDDHQDRDEYLDPYGEFRFIFHIIIPL